MPNQKRQEKGKRWALNFLAGMKSFLHYSHLFEERMMNLEVNYHFGTGLDLGWKTLAECFQPEEVGIKQSSS